MSGRVSVSGRGECPERGLAKAPGRVEGHHLSILPDDGIVVWMVWVYILRCLDNTLYIGHSNNLAAREKTHNEGRGAIRH